jgi:putative exosortase-associated protein (TIGR04073 family)
MQATFKKLLVVFTLFLCIPYNASATTYASRLGSKIGYGLMNSVTGIAELPKTVMVTSKTDGIGYAVTAGVVTGLFHTIGRTLSGASDLATFFVPTKPIVQPSFVWESWNKETTYRKTWELLP